MADGPDATGAAVGAVRPVTVWDLPIRLFHWALVFCLAGAWWSAENEEWERHLQLGLATLALILFRLIWGLVGSETARFNSFVRAPAAALEHWRALRRPGPLSAHAGHNALGAYAVLALLTSLAVQTVTGLFLSGGDLITVAAPLNSFIAPTTETILEEIHEINFRVLQALVALHLLAIVYYGAVKRLNLVRAMITGRAALPVGVPAPRIVPALWALLVLVAVAGGVRWLAGLG